MHIRSFHIDAFGVLRDLTVESLPSGTAIFLGQNEAGKSTLLDFLRATLTGYPRTRGGRDRAYITGQAHFGGSLELDTPQGLVRLTRRPGKDGGLSVLTDSAGNLLDAALWDRMLGGVSREVYASVYGFSLQELQSFQSLSSNDVRNALYGASFGAGLRSPGAALKRMETVLDGLFKARGSSQKISRALSEWEELRRRIREGEGEIERYDTLAKQREELEVRLSDLELEQKRLEREQREGERRLRVWRQWEEWRLAGIRLERLEPISATFPQDGPARLERALERQANAEREARRAEARETQIREALAACQIDERLLKAVEPLRSLTGGSSSCRNALAALPELQMALEHSRAELERELGALGAGWSLERVKGTERPLSAREQLERQAEEIRSSQMELESVRVARSRMQGELEAASAECSKYRDQLSALPCSGALPEKSELELLRVRIVRTESACRERPVREQVVLEARKGLELKLHQLGLIDEHRLDELAAAQQEIGRRAARLRDAEDELLNARRAEEVAGGEERRQTLRVDELRRKRLALGDCNSSAVESNRSALREFRALLERLRVEESSMVDAEDRLAAHLAEPTGLERSPLLMVLGSLLVAAGIGLGILYFLELETPGNVPRAPWLMALFVLVGSAVIWAGALRKRPESARHAAEAERLRTRLEQRIAQCNEIRKRAVQLCQTLFPEFVVPVTSLVKPENECMVADPVCWPSAQDLDRLEASLEQEKDRCRIAGVLEQELCEAEEELRSLRTAARSAQNGCAGLAAQLESLDRDWKAFFAGMGIADPPRADEIAAFCARIDAARLALRGVTDRQHRLEEEDGQIAELAGQIALLRKRMTGEGTDLAEPVSPEAVLEAGHNLLQLYADADRMETERARLVEVLGLAENNRQRLEQEEHKLRQREEEAVSRMNVAQAGWHSMLADMGLLERNAAQSLPPETARQMLEHMDRIQRMEADCCRLEADMQRQKSERDAVLLPLRALLVSLGRLPEGEAEQHAPEDEALLALLDTLAQDVERARLEDGERRRLRSRLAELEEEHHRTEAVADEAKRAVERLLQAAEAADPEDFLHRYAVRQERETVLRRREELEDMLRLAALDAARDREGWSDGMLSASGLDSRLSEQVFRQFLEGFARLEKDTLEAEQAELAGHLARIADERAGIDDEVRTIRIRMENQVSSDALQRDRMEAACVAESIRELSREWSRYALARHLLVEARGRFERERQPEVIRIASRLFSQVTEGKWTGINASLEDSSLRVLSPHGEPVDPEVLSRGTQEQLYLSLRLAYIRSHTVQAVSLPVIMDDVLVNFDPERARRTAGILGELNRDDESGTGHQLLFFTCHPWMAELLQKSIPESRLYVLERGAVTAREA